MKQTSEQTIIPNFMNTRISDKVQNNISLICDCIELVDEVDEFNDSDLMEWGGQGGERSVSVFL